MKIKINKFMYPKWTPILTPIPYKQQTKLLITLPDKKDNLNYFVIVATPWNIESF